MHAVLSDLIELLQLERIEENIFRGDSRDIGSPQVFGGQVLGQALSAAQQKEIAKALEKRLGRNINLETEIDASLIGGAVITAGDIVIDGSMRARLDSLTSALIN